MSNEISRIEVFCDDRLVQTIKRMLIPLKGVHEVKDQPVINAQAKNGMVRAVTNGSSLSMFVAWVRKRKVTEIGRDGIDEFMASIGKAKTAGGYLVKMAQEAGVLIKNKTKSTKRIFVYDVKLPRKS